MTFHMLGAIELEYLALSAEKKEAWESLTPLGRSAHTAWLHTDDTLYAVDRRYLMTEAEKHEGRARGSMRGRACNPLGGYFCRKCLMEKPRNHSRIKDFDFGVPYAPLRRKPLSVLNRIALCRAVASIVTVKLSSSGGAHTSYALKSHVFCVPHNGPKVTSRLIAVNMGVARTFTLQFIGEKSVFVTLRNSGRFNSFVYMDVELSLEWLSYMKQHRHPDYVDVALPDMTSLASDLREIQDQVMASAEILS